MLLCTPYAFLFPCTFLSPHPFIPSPPHPLTSLLPTLSPLSYPPSSPSFSSPPHPLTPLLSSLFSLFLPGAQMRVMLTTGQKSSSSCSTVVTWLNLIFTRVLCISSGGQLLLVEFYLSDYQTFVLFLVMFQMGWDGLRMASE